MERGGTRSGGERGKGFPPLSKGDQTGRSESDREISIRVTRKTRRRDPRVPPAQFGGWEAGQGCADVGYGEGFGRDENVERGKRREKDSGRGIGPNA